MGSDQAAPMELTNRFIARQPILDKEAQSVGYELLFRDSDTDHASFANAGQASLQVFDSAFLFGIDALCGELKAFINCTPEVLTSDFINMLPARRTVLEISGNTPPNSVVLEACDRLKRNGFLMALDNYVPDSPQEGFLPICDMVKVESSHMDPALVARVRGQVMPGTQLVAMKVETLADHERAKSLGFEMFQGFYFCVPQVMATKELGPSSVNCVRLLQATVNEELSFGELEAIIKEDPALCYRLLRFINSVEFCLRADVQSIRHALALLGERNARRWALLTGTAAGASDKPRELLRCALMRAKLLELVAPTARCSEYDGFLVGLLSLMEVMLGMPNITDRLETPTTVRAALHGKEVRLRKLLDLSIAYERSDWEACETIARGLNLSEAELSQAYMQAVTWVSKIPL